jgi:alkylhydroperoxidase family enzyme
VAGSVDGARLPPIPREEWTPEVLDAFAVQSSQAPKRTGPPPANSRKGSNVLGTFAHHPRLTAAYFAFSGYILYRSSMTPRDRELAILRVAARRNAEYEWAQHVHLGREAGVSDEEIERVLEGPEADGWSPLDVTLLTAVDELITDARISDATWSALSETYDVQQLMDLVFTIGAYELLAMAFNSFGLQLDGDLESTTPRLGVGGAHGGPA